jgi:hypothetical protein
MHTKMSQNTRQEVLTQMRRRSLRAGRRYKSQLVSQLVELFGYHRKPALRALRSKPVLLRAPFARGRPKEYSPDQLLPPLKAIWLAALRPCGVRLKACLPEWLADDEADHRRLEADVRRPCCRPAAPRWIGCCARPASNIAAGRPPGPANGCAARFPCAPTGPKRPPGTWNWTPWRCVVAVWMTGTAGCSMRWTPACRQAGPHHLERLARPAQPQRSQCLQALGRPPRPAALLAVRAGQRPVCRQASNGSEFINHQLVRYCRAQTPPIHFTRSRPYKKNDQAHIEQKNFTHVRLWFGYARYDHPEVWPRINALCRGPLDHLLNYCLPTMKLEKKERVGGPTVRKYGPTCTPLARVLACAETKARLRAGMNAFAVRREVDRQLKAIEAARRWTEP